MAFELFLIAEPEVSAQELEAVLTRVSASALLLKAGDEDDHAYSARARTLAKLVQKHGCAVLLDNRPDLVRRAYVDGVHMSGGIKALREAIGELKPDFIVGTGDIGSRHEAMLRGELDVDYLMFGDRTEPELDGREMAQWWAQTFEVPSVYLAGFDQDGELDGIECEFVAVAQPDWDKLDAVAGGAP